MGKITYTTQQLQTILDNANIIKDNLTIEGDIIQGIKLGTSTLKYNNLEQCLEIVYNNGQVQQIGREGTSLVYSEDGIANGVPVYITGAIQFDAGNGDTLNLVKVAPASNVNIAKSQTTGWTTIPIDAEGIGIVIWKGDLHFQDTSGTVIGRTVYLGSSGWTSTPPSSPNLIVELGYITKVGTTDGVIQVHPPHFSNSSHTDLINQNEDPNFQHLPSDQVAKLDTIENSAEVNVNADWNSITGDTQILNKPTDLTDLSTHNVTELSDITSAGSGSIITTVERGKLDDLYTELGDGSNVVENVGTSTDNAIARFDGVTGKLLQGGGSITNLDTGEVGIGETAPVGKLDVSGGFIYARNGVVDVGKEQIRIGRTDNDIRYHSISSYHTVNAAANYLKFKVHDGAASAPYTLQTTVMTMLGNGNVGIGTETPPEKLSVHGNIASLDNGGTARFRISTTEVAPYETGLQTFNYHLVLDASGTGQNEIIFRTGVGAIGTGTEKARITSSGLDVTGNLALTGTVNGRDVSADGDKLDNIYDVDAAVIKKKATKLIDPTNLNEEVVMVTIPVGYIGVVCSSEIDGNVSNSIGYSFNDDNTPTTNGTIFSYFTPHDGTEQGYQMMAVTSDEEYGGHSIDYHLKGGTDIRVKVTTAAAGVTNKVLLNIVVLLKPKV
jgi:hypothetical protein